MVDRLRFAVCTFDRVFDTNPKAETLRLDQLVRGLLRFEIKPQVLRAVQRATAQADDAWAAWTADGYRSGRPYARLAAAAERARQRGADPAVAARAEYDKQLTDARGAPKRDLRLWAPALYADGERRGSENVVHLSCLVLDYDKGLSPAEALRVWAPWFHVAHSTWSHTEAVPKFRVVLPLAAPVRAEDWAGVWSWAEGLAGAWIDPAMKGRGATFALPALATAGQARIAVLHEAPLLDLLAEGLVPTIADPPPPVAEMDRPPSHFNGGVLGHTYLELAPETLVQAPPDPPDVSGEWDERSDEWDALFEEDP